MGVCVEGGIGKKTNDLLRSNWEYPENTVVFSHAGHAGFALDYRERETPGVIYVYSERYPHIIIANLAPSFDAFVANLQPWEPGS